MNITKSAINNTICKRNISYTQSAREAWGMILNQLDAGTKILLPSYIGITDREGSGIYDPVITSCIDHDFYMLNNNLSIPVKELEAKLRVDNYSLILLVHYFGFQIPEVDKIIQICNKYNVIVVEDCAHLYTHNLSNMSNAGYYGDYTFYSLHKNIPLEYGGMLLVNNNVLNIETKHSDRIDIDYFHALQSYDVQAISIKRKLNFRLMTDLLKDISGIKIMIEIQESDIPHTLPIIVENGLREKLYFWLIDHGITLIALYYRLIDPLQQNRYKEMLYISDSILNLPIHQDMNSESITHVVNMLKRGLKELHK